MDMEMPSPPEREPVPSADLLRIAAGGAGAAFLSGLLFGSVKPGHGLTYFLTGSYFGDGLVAGLVAAAVSFFVCSRLAERIVEAVERRLPVAMYAMIGIGGGIGLLVGMFLTICINIVKAKASQ